MRTYYILLKEKVATKKDRGLLSRQKSDKTHVLEGSLWYLSESEYANASKFLENSLSLCSVDYDGVVVDCGNSEAAKLIEEEFELLYALATCKERLKLFQDDGFMKEAVTIRVESDVYVTTQGIPERTPGKVKYRGCVPGQNGMWFGIELATPYHGKGTSDGAYKRERYFTCPPYSAVFVSINKLKKRENLLQQETQISPVISPSLSTPSPQYPPPPTHHSVHDIETSTIRRSPFPTYNPETDPEKPPIELGEKVVWISDTGPENAYVKWMGFLPDARRKEWIIGVEFDNAIGTGTGKYKDTQLFNAKQNHASLVPVQGLIKYAEMYPNGTPVTPLNSPNKPAINGTLEHGLKSRGPPSPEKSPKTHNRNNTADYAIDTVGVTARNPRTTKSYDDLHREQDKSFKVFSPHSQYNTASRTGSSKSLAQEGLNRPPSIPQKLEKTEVEKSIYDQDPDHLYANVKETKEKSKFGTTGRKPFSASAIELEKFSCFGTKDKENQELSNQKAVTTTDISKLVHPSDHVEQCPTYIGKSVFYEPLANKHGILDTDSASFDGISAQPGECDPFQDGYGYMQPGDKEIVPLEKTDGIGGAHPPAHVVDNSTFYTSPRQKRKKPFANNHSNTMHTTTHNAHQPTPTLSASNSNYAISDVVKSPGEATDGVQTLVAERNGTKQDSKQSSPKSSPDKEVIQPISLDPKTVQTDLDFGSMVEVVDNPPDCQYGVIRWLGYLKDKNKPIAGIEMEEESSIATDGTFAGHRLFTCPPKKGCFFYLHKLRKDSRFEESQSFLTRRQSQVFGSLECPDVQGIIEPLKATQKDIAKFIGQNKGIQGHHNSCYMDSTLFSMFGFSTAFDTILHRQRQSDDLTRYEEVQQTLRDGIVNPLRKNFYVRADKVLRLRTQLDQLSSVQGLMSEEKDPEEFLNGFLQQIMKAEPFIKLSSGQESFMYQLFVEKDDNIVLPDTQQLLGMSFLQSDLKLAEVPSCLILQMPRFGKDYKMYRRIVPSLYLDITDILEFGPRECTICGSLATFECKDCYRNRDFGETMDKIAFCDGCIKSSHRSRRSSHRPRAIRVNPEYKQHVADMQSKGRDTSEIPRETLELFAVICIETSHYVSFVKCGEGPDAPWVFFDSMADRMGAQHGYNVPEVKPCDYLPDWLQEDHRAQIASSKDDKDLPEQMKRLLCDGYICMYQNRTLQMYT